MNRNPMTVLVVGTTTGRTATFLQALALANEERGLIVAFEIDPKHTPRDDHGPIYLGFDEASELKQVTMRGFRQLVEAMPKQIEPHVAPKNNKPWYRTQSRNRW